MTKLPVVSGQEAVRSFERMFTPRIRGFFT